MVCRIREVIRQSHLSKVFERYQNILKIENDEDREKALELYYAEDYPSDIEAADQRKNAEEQKMQKKDDEEKAKSKK